MLQAERDFINLAEAHMAQLRLVDGDAVAIEDVLRDRAGHEPQALLARQIKSAAQNVKARAIAVAARRCEMLINKHFAIGPDSSNSDIESLKIKTDLLLGLRTLDRLIGLYGAGLREIDPEFANAPDFSSVDVSPPQGKDSSAKMIAAPMSSAAPKAANILQGQSAAAQQLSNLIHIAPVHDQGALIRLVKIAAPQITVPQMGVQPDVTPSLDLRGLQAPAASSTDIAPCVHIGLEALMTTITDKALGMAYHSGRRISLSYDVGEHVVSAKMAERITHRLDLICAALIEHSFVSSPNDPMAQISITAGPSGTSLDITANGTPLPSQILSHHADMAQLESQDVANHITVSLLSGASDMPDVLDAKETAPDLLSHFDCDLLEQIEAIPESADRIKGQHIQAKQDSLEQRI